MTKRFGRQNRRTRHIGYDYEKTRKIFLFRVQWTIKLSVYSNDFGSVVEPGLEPGPEAGADFASFVGWPGGVSCTCKRSGFAGPL